MKKIILLVIIALLAGCSQAPKKALKPGDVQAIDNAFDFISDTVPAPANIGGHNPLDYAAKRIGLDFNTFELPRAEEGHYRLACRFPIIDYVSNRPLYMKQWAEETTETINQRHQAEGLKSIDYLLEVLKGTDKFPELPANINEKSFEDIEKTLIQLNYSEKYQKILSALLQKFSIACQLASEAKKNLSDKDRQFFNENPGYFLAPDGKNMPSITGSVDSHFTFIERARNVKYEYIFLASKILNNAVQDYINATTSFGKEDFFSNINKCNENYNFYTPSGMIVIAGFADNNHSQDAALLIDLGGNDTYTNNAGGSYYSLANVALCIDHSGDDKYETPGKNYTQGCGFLGVGYLVDLAGNDKFTAKNFSQGCGIMGVGAIYELDGNDIYDGQAVCQGAGLFGLGAVLDSSGNDSYDASTIAQGAATTLGVGIVSDIRGDDKYLLATDKSKDCLGSDLRGYGQGGALSFRAWPFTKKLTAYGGVGILTDYSGNDIYQTAGWCDQGGSYIMSLGALVDYDGNDRYKNSRGGGSTIHTGNAILIDKNGDDIYETGFLGFGSGSDRSPGIFIDYHGNDTYGTSGTTGSFGAGCKPKGFSLFIDYEGDDKYTCKQPTTFKGHDWDSLGGVWPESVPYLWPYAICLDLNGNDDYQMKNRANNSERFSYGHGIHLDTQWQGGDAISKMNCPLEPYQTFMLIENTGSPSVHREIHLLMNPDLFIRFQAVGRIVNKYGVDSLPRLTDIVVNSRYRQFNRDVMECLHYFLSRNQITEKEIPHLVKLFKAKDEEVRTIMAHNMGLWNFKQAEDALIEGLKDESARVRRYCLIALMSLKSDKGITPTKKLALKDADEEVRRVAMIYLGRIDKTNSSKILLEALKKDPSGPVKYAAADAFSIIYDERALEPLRQAAQSPDYYLRRAAAKGLARLYQKESIEILIDSMDFLSIDTGYNYGENVANYVAAYAGTDLTDRYDKSKWKEWYKENKEKIDIKKNVDAYVEYNEVTSDIATAGDEEKVNKYEAFLSRHPEHKMAKEKLGGLLNQIAWNMVSAPKGSDNYNPKQGLTYALRAAELNPIPMIVDTLVEAYYVNGNIDKAIEICREELKKKPEEKMFSDRLEKYLKEKPVK